MHQVLKGVERLVARFVARGGQTMSCRDTIHLICWYLEGKLSPAVETQIEQHLSQCRDCRMVLDAANTTLDLYFGSSETTEIGSSSRAA